MTREELIVYVANVLAVAAADGDVSAAEAGAMRAVLARLGADERLLSDARELMDRQAPYELEALDDPADCMHNIEDMVLMSLADGDVNPAESGPLEAFLSDLGFAQADMDLIVQRVRSRLRELGLAVPEGYPRGAARSAYGPPPLLPICRPKPPLPDGTRPGSRVRPPSPARATPPNSRPAARPARGQGLPPQAAQPPSPAPAAEAAPARGNAPPPAAPAPPPAEVTPPPAAVTRPAGGGSYDPPSAASLTVCAGIRRQSAHGACYCFGLNDRPLNPWGCRLLAMDWTADADWLRLGHFRDGDTFVFDREAIGERLQSRLAAVAGCPFLLRRFAGQALSALPSRATTSGRWRHHRSGAAVPDSLTVRVRSYRHGCGRERVATADGFAPENDHDAYLMIRRTARRLGLQRELAAIAGTERSLTP